MTNQKTKDEILIHLFEIKDNLLEDLKRVKHLIKKVGGDEEKDTKTVKKEGMASI